MKKLKQANVEKGFPPGSDGKESTFNAGDLGSIPVLEDALKGKMATHSSILARIPWTEEPGGPQSSGLERVRYNLRAEQQQWEKSN